MLDAHDRRSGQVWASWIERQIELFHCPVANGCAAGFFVLNLPSFHLLSLLS